MPEGPFCQIGAHIFRDFPRWPSFLRCFFKPCIRSGIDSRTVIKTNNLIITQASILDLVLSVQVTNQGSDKRHKTAIHCWHMQLTEVDKGSNQLEAQVDQRPLPG